MRPVFCGNFEHDTRHSDLERLFSEHGRVDRVDMKSGYAFIYFEDERDAESAIRNLDDMPFGYGRRKLSVEWSRGERGPRHRDGSRSMTNTKPTRTLFVINFDPIRTGPRDIEKHFEPYGKIMHVRIRRNFAFVQYETLEEASKALEHTDMRLSYPFQMCSRVLSALFCFVAFCSKILDRVVSVEFALRDDAESDDRRGSPRKDYRGHDGSPYGRPGSPPYRRDRPSPDYGRRRSPDYGRRSSPDYGRRPSLGYGRRPSPDYGRRPSAGYERRMHARPRSPVRERYDRPIYEREVTPDHGRYRSRSPIRKPRA